MGEAGRAGALPRASALVFAAVAVLACWPSASAALSINAPAFTYTGALFGASANVSEPQNVVLFEWDFDGDGAVDLNRTDTPEAGYVFAIPKPDYRIGLNITRLVNGTLTTESAFRQLNVLNGTPSVSIDLPDRLVSGVPLAFKAHAVDPDAPPSGPELFSYRWEVDGAPSTAAGQVADLTIDSSGAHEIAVVVTDEEGLSARAAVTAQFGSPGLFEGKSGVADLGLLVSAGSLALGLPLVALRRREAVRSTLQKERDDALASAQARSAGTAARRAPRKAAFGAASGEASGSAPRISLGGSPSSLLNSKECPVCHSAYDLAAPECPFCKANGEASDLESRLASEAYAAIDLSEVNAILQHARRERHLGKLERHRELLQQAEAKAAALVEERTRSAELRPRARDALERAQREAPAAGDRLDRAASYLKLAESLAGAKQHGKAARHARRAMEILETQELEGDDPCHACGGAVTAARLALALNCPHCGVDLAPPGSTSPTEGAKALEARVAEQIRALKESVVSHTVDLDAESFQLVAAAEDFERKAQWAQALEVLAALREKLERARAAGQSDPGDAGGQAPPDVPP
jgi:tetratricopeptide (TPR) repeat protein